MEVKIDLIGGNCPVQAEGTVDGKPFYFRARGEHWSMGIGGDPVMNPEWEHHEEYGAVPFAAGWMELDEARAFIDKAVAIYGWTVVGEDGKKAFTDKVELLIKEANDGVSEGDMARWVEDVLIALLSARDANGLCVVLTADMKRRVLTAASVAVSVMEGDAAKLMERFSSAE